MEAASLVESVVELREQVDVRNAELKEVGAQIKALLKETHQVIIASRSELGSDFGLDEVKAPARLKEIMPTVIPTNEAELKSILNIVRHQIIYDTGMEVDRIRLSLSDMKIKFDELNLDQYLGPVEGEESLKDRLDDAAFATFFMAVVDKITAQAAAISTQRSFFRKALENANHSSEERRESMENEVIQALQDPQMRIDGEDMNGCIVSIFREALWGRKLHDLHLRTAFFRRPRGFLLPVVAKPAFDIFERLNDCAEYARPKRGNETKPSTN